LKEGGVQLITVEPGNSCHNQQREQKSYGKHDIFCEIIDEEENVVKCHEMYNNPLVMEIHPSIQILIYILKHDREHFCLYL